MADVTYYKGYIGEEDLSLGRSTFVRRDKDGVYKTLTQINRETFNVDWYYDVRDYVDLLAAATALNALSDNVTLLISEEQVISSDITFNSNVYLKFVGDGSLSVDSGYIVTINAFSNIDAPYNKRIFRGAGSVVFSAITDIIAAWYGFDVSATGGNNSTYFATIISSMVSGSNVIIFSGEYDVTGLLTISKSCKISANNVTLSWPSDTSANRGIIITASNVEIDGLILDGPQAATAVTTQVGIKAYGADASNYISGLKIVNCEITDWCYGIQGSFVEYFDVSNNYLHDLYQVGISFASSQYGKIHKNTVEDIPTSISSISYGISLTKSDGTTVIYPRSSDIIVSDNIIDGVEDWEGLDTHGGRRIIFVNNIVRNCKIGIACVNGKDAAGDSAQAPLEVSVIGNIIESGVTDGSAYYGISLVGAYNAGLVEAATGQIKDNIIKGHGREATTNDAAILLYYTSGVKVSGNLIREPAQHGIHFYQYNDMFSCVGNTIVDGWSNTAATRAINVSADYNTGFIGNNVLSVDAKSATYVMTYGVYIGNDTHNDIVIGENYSEAGNYIAGTLTYVSFSSRQGGDFLLKNVMSYTDFSAASTAPYKNFNIALAPGFVITDVWWYLDTEFAGGSVSAATLKFGVVGATTDGFFPAENVFTGAGTGYKDSAVTSRGVYLYSAAPIPIQYFCTAATSLRATLTLTDDTGDHLTAGQATIWVKGYRVK